MEDQYSKKTSVKDRLEATKTLSKLLGMETKKVDVNANVTTMIVDDLDLLDD